MLHAYILTIFSLGFTQSAAGQVLQAELRPSKNGAEIPRGGAGQLRVSRGLKAKPFHQATWNLTLGGGLEGHGSFEGTPVKFHANW